MVDVLRCRLHKAPEGKPQTYSVTVPFADELNRIERCRSSPRVSSNPWFPSQGLSLSLICYWRDPGALMMVL